MPEPAEHDPPNPLRASVHPDVPPYMADYVQTVVVWMPDAPALHRSPEPDPEYFARPGAFRAGHLLFAPTAALGAYALWWTFDVVGLVTTVVGTALVHLHLGRRRKRRWGEAVLARDPDAVIGAFSGYFVTEGMLDQQARVSLARTQRSTDTLSGHRWRTYRTPEEVARFRRAVATAEWEVVGSLLKHTEYRLWLTAADKEGQRERIELVRVELFDLVTRTEGRVRSLELAARDREDGVAPGSTG